MSTRPPRASRLREDRGTATAETAIVLPVVVLLVAVLAVVGVAGAQQVRVDSAARAAAREVARGQSDADAVTAARRTAGEQAQVAVGHDGAWVRVEVARTLRPAGGVLAGLTLPVRGTATARLEPQLLPESGAP